LARTDEEPFSGWSCVGISSEEIKARMDGALDVFAERVRKQEKVPSGL